MTAMKRICIAWIACALLLALSTSALAESCPVRVGGNGAMVYNASGDVVASLPAGTKLTLTGRKGSICQVSYKGKTGYMKKSDLKKESAAETASGAEASASDGATPMNATGYVVSDGAKVYNAKGKALKKMSMNAQVTVTAVKGDICQVKSGGKTGYMHKYDLSTKPVKGAEADAGAIEPRTAYVAQGGAKVYSARGKAVGKLDGGSQVSVTAVKGDVCRISVGGKTGYMRKSDLTASKPKADQSSSHTAYVDQDGARVYSVDGKTLARLDSDTKLTVTAVQGDVCQVSAGGKVGYMDVDDLSTKKPDQTDGGAPSGSNATPAKGTAKEMDWWKSDIQKIFPRGGTATVTDVDTGLAWNEQRRGGTNHADVQPVTAADTAALKQAYGGTWSWARRAIFVTINGENYAASMNGMPHGGGSIADNDFNGHHCIHFTNSRTHGSNRVCSLHQDAINKAANTTM